MSIVVRYAPGEATPEQYDEVVRRLEESGNWPPDGLDVHVAFRSGNNFRVSEIWDSQEQLQAFGERLTPLLEDAGIQLVGAPEVFEVYNLLRRGGSAGGRGSGGGGSAGENAGSQF